MLCQAAKCTFTALRYICACHSMTAKPPCHLLGFTVFKAMQATTYSNHTTGLGPQLTCCSPALSGV
jgi:hypothetical protein